MDEFIIETVKHTRTFTWNSPVIHGPTFKHTKSFPLLTSSKLKNKQFKKEKHFPLTLLLHTSLEFDPLYFTTHNKLYSRFQTGTHPLLNVLLMPVCSIVHSFFWRDQSVLHPSLVQKSSGRWSYRQMLYQHLKKSMQVLFLMIYLVILQLKFCPQNILLSYFIEHFW